MPSRLLAKVLPISVRSSSWLRLPSGIQYWYWPYALMKSLPEASALAPAANCTLSTPPRFGSKRSSTWRQVTATIGASARLMRGSEPSGNERSIW